jgi:hypothetical protein
MRRKFVFSFKGGDNIVKQKRKKLWRIAIAESLIMMGISVVVVMPLFSFSWPLLLEADGLLRLTR